MGDVSILTAEMIRRCPLAIASSHHYRASGECLCALDLAAGPATGSVPVGTWPLRPQKVCQAGQP